MKWTASTLRCRNERERRSGDSRAPALAVYVIWILFDLSRIWVVLASGRMVRPALVYAGIAAALDVTLAAVYYWLTEYSTAYMVITALLQIGYLALITTVMWVRLKGPVRQDRWQGRWLGLGCRLDTAEARRRPSLFLFVVPLLPRGAAAEIPVHTSCPKSNSPSVDSQRR